MDQGTLQDCQDLAHKVVTAIVRAPDKEQEHEATLVETFKDVYDMGAGDAAGDPAQAKSLLLSKTFWGIIIGGAAQIAPRVGLHIGSDQVTTWSFNIVSLLGSGLAMYGRLKAMKKIR